MTEPLRGVFITAAFARTEHARYAIRILEVSNGLPVRARIRHQRDDKGNVQMVLLDVEVGGLGRDRIRTAIAGGHGVVIDDSERAGRQAV
jgi:hypothetical protein